jgi:hypothetical protein
MLPDEAVKVVAYDFRVEPGPEGKYSFNHTESAGILP